MSHKRLVWADSLKGLLIVLVVLGHAIQGVMGEKCETVHLWNMIYSFHMPAFMAVSGFLSFRTKGCLRGRLSTVYRRFRQLVIPFIVWTIILLCVNNHLTVSQIGRTLLYPDKGLWFLWVLFLINVVFLWGDWVSETLKIHQEIVVLLLCLLFSGIMVIFDVRVLGFQFIAYYFIFYSAGFYLHKYYEKAVTKNKWVLALLIVIWSILAWFWNMHNLPEFLTGLPLHTSLVQYCYRFVTAIVAIYLLFAISPMILNSEKFWNSLSVGIGRLSLGIYTVHFIIIGKIIQEYRLLGLNDAVLIISSFISALLISWLIVWLLAKWKITATWMLGKF